MRIYDRGFQVVMGTGMKIMPSSKQEVIAGPGSLRRIPNLMLRKKLYRPLIVTGPRVSKTEFFQRLVTGLESAEKPIHPVIFDQVEPDPTTDLVELVMERYEAERCDCFIALGGGSNMDAAKAAAAGRTRPGKSLTQLGGLMKVRRKTPFMIAVPTTAGTGSECTVAAVITDSRTHRKFAINDPVLCPDIAVLDADLTADLPPEIVAATGMDALTHAVEAYLNRTYHKPGTGALGASMLAANAAANAGKITAASQGQSTARLCLQAVRDIMLYLPFVYEEAVEKQALREATQNEDTDDAAKNRKLPMSSSPEGYTRARQKMLEASFMAGQAFTVACVGNVHAIAHTLGGLYHIPHGQANAVLLPVILEDYGRKVSRPLKRLAKEAGLRGDEMSAEGFIAKIRQMNREMGMPERFPQIRDEDLEQMAGWACREANPLYPVPVIYNKSDVKRILKSIR